MTEKEFEKIFNVDKTHQIIYSRLGEDGRKTVKEIMLKLPSNEFREFNPDAEFDVSDVPIPFKATGGSESISLSQDVEREFGSLLCDINESETNLEYPGVAIGFQNDNVDYFATKRFSVGESQQCTYDWEWIKGFVKNPNNQDTKLAIFHTHPNPLGKQFKTLYNKYPEELSSVGVRADGLNLSLSDIYVMQYLDMIIEENNSKIKPQALVLMHNGELKSFSTTGGLKMQGSRTIEKVNTKQNEDN